MRLDALKLAVDYVTHLPAASQRSAEMVVDIAKTFMIFLEQDTVKVDNPAPGSATPKSKTLNLSGQGQSSKGSQ